MRWRRKRQHDATGQVPEEWAAPGSADEYVDPEFDFHDPEMERARLAHIKRLDEEQAPFLQVLARKGVDITDPEALGKLSNFPRPEDARLLPVVAAWLPEIRDEGTRETLVLMLATPWSLKAAPEATPALLSEYRRGHESDTYRYTIGQALLARRDPAGTEDYIELAIDDTYDALDREPLLDLLAQLRTPSTDAALKQLATTRTLGAYARHLLRHG